MSEGVSAAIVAMYEEGRRAWPEVPLGVEDFARFVDERATADAERATLRASDLYLACACARGEGRALAVFERRYASEVPSFLAGQSASPGFVEDVRQQLRERLFVDKKIAQYSGRGSLASWLRVVTLRVAANLRRGERPHVELADAVPAPAADPELATIRSRYGDAFRLALRDAIAGLPADDRAVLRLHYLDGLNIDKIAVVFGVSRATIGRRMIAVRERVVDETNRLLGDRLNATPDELRSLLRLLRSQLAASLSVLLRER